MKLYSALYEDFYPFKDMELFSEYEAVNFPEEMEEDGALVVWGGGDISPSLYNKAVSSATYADAKLSRRDHLEWELMKAARDRGMPIIGICRGAQMLCALAGGFLIQDVTGHGSEHMATTIEGRSFPVSSLHHQMLYPFDVEHQMIAWSKHKKSRHYLDVDEPIQMPIEPEFVYFPKEKGIAIQWHPEYMDVNCEANQYVKDKIREYI